MTAFSRTFIRPLALFSIAFFLFFVSPAQRSIQQQKNFGEANEYNERRQNSNTGKDFDITRATLSANSNVAFNDGLASGVAMQSTDPTCSPIVSIRASQTTICLGTGITFSATVANDGINGAFKWKK